MTGNQDSSDDSEHSFAAFVHVALNISPLAFYSSSKTDKSEGYFANEVNSMKKPVMRGIQLEEALLDLMEASAHSHWSKQATLSKRSLTSRNADTDKHLWNCAT
jgi:hypothetical protein